jgi:hypothetical protein
MYRANDTSHRNWNEEALKHQPHVFEVVTRKMTPEEEQKFQGVVEVKKKMPNLPKLNKAECERLLESGMSKTKIMSLYGLNPGTFYTMIAEWGLKGWKPTKAISENIIDIAPIDTAEQEPTTAVGETEEEVAAAEFEFVEEDLPFSVDELDEREERDMVDHPPHYTQGDIECIDAIRAAVEGLNGFEAYCSGTMLKYNWRWKHKNGIEDLDKLIWYAERLKSEIAKKQDVVQILKMKKDIPTVIEYNGLAYVLDNRTSRKRNG